MNTNTWFLAESRERIRTAREEEVGWQGFLKKEGECVVWEKFPKLSDAKAKHRGNRKIEVRFLPTTPEVELATGTYRAPSVTEVTV